MSGRHLAWQSQGLVLVPGDIRREGSTSSPPSAAISWGTTSEQNGSCYEDTLVASWFVHLPNLYSPWGEPIFGKHVVHEEVEQGYYANL